MKLLKPAFLLFLAFLFFEGCKQANKKIYNLKIGETFKIRLGSNGSTGYSNCWLNKATVKSVILIDKKYIADNPNLIGGGGEEILTFKSVAKGTDSIKYSSCPTGREQKMCETFSDGSVKADTVFIAVVTE